jgi:hypothetical protein
MLTELSFVYDPEMRPVTARCSVCGQLMAPPPSTVRDAADMVMWLSQQFLEHKRLKHPQQPSVETKD